MTEFVGDGEELMPPRYQENMTSNSQPSDAPSGQSQAAANGPTSPIRKLSRNRSGPTTPIRKLSRNRGLVLQEQSVVEGSSPEGDGEPSVVEDSPLCDSDRAAAIRKGKRKMR